MKDEGLVEMARLNGRMEVLVEVTMLLQKAVLGVWLIQDFANAFLTQFNDTTLRSVATTLTKGHPANGGEVTVE